MPTVTPTHKVNFASIVANETNLHVRSKLEQWMATHTANTSYVPTANRLLDIANHSSQKAAIIAFVSALV